MKLKQEKTDATKKKGMALDDNALENVTGGNTWFAVTDPSDMTGNRTFRITDSYLAACMWQSFGHGPRSIISFEFDGVDTSSAKNYYNDVINSQDFELVETNSGNYKLVRKAQ